MSDFDAWIFFDGPAPESLRQTLDALRDPLPEDEELELLALLEQVDAKLSPPPEGASGPVLLDDAEVESAPPTPGAPALQKEEEKAPAPPLPVVRPPSPLAKTANSPGGVPSIQPALAASGVRPAPTVRVVGAKEHPRTLELPVMDPSQGARRAPPEMTLYDYVAYRTELELWPEHRDELHEKYKVDDEAAYQEIVRTWERDLAESPVMRALADSMSASWLEYGRAMQRARSGGT
jgi:hypothetical protein